AEVRHAPTVHAWSANAGHGAIQNSRHAEQGTFERYRPGEVEPKLEAEGQEHDQGAYGLREPAPSSAEHAQRSDRDPGPAPATTDRAAPLLAQLRHAGALPGDPDPSPDLAGPLPREAKPEPETIASRLARPRTGA